MVYIVKTHDILSDIAKRFGTTVEAILALNPSIANPDLIFPGEQIRIPPRESFQKSAHIGSLVQLFLHHSPAVSSLHQHVLKTTWLIRYIYHPYK